MPSPSLVCAQRLRLTSFTLAVIVAAGGMAGCPAPNSSPVANAGAALTAAPGSTVTLDASGSTDPDGDNLAFSWSQISGTSVALSNANTARPTFTAPNTPGVLIFRVTVSDGEGGTATADATVTVTAAGNRSPTANAGEDQDVQGGATVTLTGNGTDPDNDPVTFAWTQTAGTTVTLNNANTASATLIAPLTSGALTFRLTVNDGRGGTATDDVNVNVTVPETLFVSNFTGQNVVSFRNPQNVNGNFPPDTNLAGGQTQLNQPADAVVNAAGSLYVTNFAGNSITIYDNALSANGNFAPSRNIQGAATGLNGPVSLAIDTANDLLFVANFTAGNILVFTDISQSTFNGNVAPTRTITNAAITNPLSINLDANGNLYIARNVNVVVYANAANVNGNIAPNRTLTSGAFNAVFDVYIDAQDRMYVANSVGGTVATFTNAASLNGPVMPSATLTIPGAGALTAIAVDSANRAFIVDNTNNRIYSYDNIASQNGTVNPPRTIEGANTQLTGAIRLFLLER